MSGYDLHSNIDDRVALKPASIVSNTTTVDAGLFDAAVLSSGETLGSLTGFTVTDDDTTIRVGSIGKKRFQRLSLVSTEATPAVNQFAAYAILSNPHTAPIQQ